MSLRPVCYLLLGLAFAAARYIVIAAGLSVFQTEVRRIAVRAFQNAHHVQLRADDVQRSFEALRTQHQSVTGQL